MRALSEQAELFAREGHWDLADETASGAIAMAQTLWGDALDNRVVNSVLASIATAAQIRAAASLRAGDALGVLRSGEAGRARVLSFALEGADLPIETRAQIAADRAELQRLGNMNDTRALLLRLRINRLLGRVPNAPPRIGADLNQAPRSSLADVVVTPVVNEMGGGLAAIPLKGPAAGGIVASPRMRPSNVETLIEGPESGEWDGWARANTLRRAAQRSDSPLENWRQSLDTLGTRLWEFVGEDVERLLQQGEIALGARIVWIPTARLSLFPIGLATNPQTGRCLLEDYEIIHSPSWETFRQAEQRAGVSAPTRQIAGIFNPTGDLPFAHVERSLIESAANPIALMAIPATPDKGVVLQHLAQAQIWHFATHGRFDLQNSREAGVAINRAASGHASYLTIEDILRARIASGVRLVVLSACDTGLVELGEAAEEFVGLPNAFLQAGAAGVIATLWPVDDLSTSFLMWRFYSQYFGSGVPPSSALRQAQLWLRDCSIEELLSVRDRIDLPHDQSRSFDRFIEEEEATHSGARPFAHPTAWGGFVYIGA